MKILANSPTVHRKTPLKIAIVTGLSDPSHCMLSDAQRTFLETMIANIDGRAGKSLREGKVSTNFPFLEPASPDANSESNKQKPIISASVNNIKQYLLSDSPSYHARSLPHWKAFFESAEKFYLVTGSCGLQLVANAIGKLPPGPIIEILALGPVASKKSKSYIQQLNWGSLTIVQGSADWISRCFFNQGCRVIPRLGHLQYWTDPSTQEFACNWLSRKTSES